MNELQVTALYVYPVKSMRGISLDEATLTANGLLHDRVWMVVRPDGRFVTQRGLPRLALVGTRLDDGGVTHQAGEAGRHDESLNTARRRASPQKIGSLYSAAPIR